MKEGENKLNKSMHLVNFVYMIGWEHYVYRHIVLIADDHIMEIKI